MSPALFCAHGCVVRFALCCAPQSLHWCKWNPLLPTVVVCVARLVRHFLCSAAAPSRMHVKLKLTFVLATRADPSASQTQAMATAGTYCISLTRLHLSKHTRSQIWRGEPCCKRPCRVGRHANARANDFRGRRNAVERHRICWRRAPSNGNSTVGFTPTNERLSVSGPATSNCLRTTHASAKIACIVCLSLPS